MSDYHLFLPNGTWPFEIGRPLTSTVVLSEEIETTMRNMGATSLDQLNPSFVNTKRLEMELPDDLDFKFTQAALKAKL